LKYKYPIVFMHGGGHTGSFFRSTPDGRDGWFTSFTRRGFAVYAVDGANRGRGGWDPTARFAASQGLEPPSSMEAANIYTEESAWTGFRWGPTFGTFYSNTQFPKAYVNEYLNLIQAAYRNLAPPAPQIQNDLIAADLGALIDKIGPCILLGWSTGGGNVLSAATSTPARIKKVKGLIGIEGFPGAAGNNPDPALVAKIPVLAIEGDNLSPAATQAYTATLVGLGGDAKTIFLPDIGIFGNGHTMAVELNNEKIADVMEAWIAQHVKW
jgi:pimeloyl-ACP methyl ester carboxylesterase